MSKKIILYNEDILYKVQEWPYPAAKDLTLEEMKEWFQKEGYKGKQFIFAKTNEYYKSQNAYNMGYAFAWAFSMYVGTTLLICFFGLWFLVKVLKIIG